MSLAPRWLYHLRRADGTLLYIGCSLAPLSRLRDHLRKPWGTEIAIFEAEPFPFYEAWAREQHEIRTAPGVHNVTQLETARRGWVTRNRRKALHHAAGERCQDANCRACSPYLTRAAS